jgi:DNA-directed RNA polymerase specialized sigma24 family protein
VKLPAGVSEADFLDATQRAVDMLAHSFVFGYYDKEDIAQHAFMEAVKVMATDAYDTSRPLANFLYVHLRNRLLNLLRKQYRRSDPPCNLCHHGRQAEHPDGEVCKKYKAWRKRNATKANLAQPVPIDSVPDEQVRAADDPHGAELGETLAAIDARLDPALRADYLRMRAGQWADVPKPRRERVEAAVREILNEQEEGRPAQ